ncbi:Latrophilin/CL-1-like GPS domain protein, partial [Ostertagia ostertagi]
MLPTLVTNTNASQFDFLTGENLGFTARNIDCSSATDDGLIDYGNIFELFNGSIPGRDRYNSIYIPLNDICSQLQASQLFMTVYRNRKLFTGTKQYQSYGSVSTIAKRSAGPKDTEPLPSPCSRQIALPEEAPVMTGTILNDGVAVTRLATESTVAVLRFNITNVLTPLHGHFRVTWWDTEKLEWSTENQCETTTEGDTIVARCKHLTDFTLIVDAALNDPNVCETALIDLGYVVNSLSIISLAFLMLMSLCAYWPSLRSSRALGILTGYAIPTRDFVSLTHKLSLLLFYVVFTIFSDKKVSGEACEFFGALSYWLLL